MKQQTLLFLFRNNRKEVLLAMKKRGFGEGKWNGVGGKVEEGETPEEAVIREAEEEIGVEVDPHDLVHQGAIQFIFPPENGLHIYGSVYSASVWSGEPVETEEMRPEWFSVEEIPYKEMWIDDPFWLPQFIEGKHIDAQFHLSNDGSEVLSQNVDSHD